MTEHGASINVPPWNGEPREAGEVWRLRKGKRLAPCHLWTHSIGAPQQFAVHRDARFGELFAAVHKKTINMNSNPAPAADRAQVDVVPAENIVRPASIEVVGISWIRCRTMMSRLARCCSPCDVGRAHAPLCTSNCSPCVIRFGSWSDLAFTGLASPGGPPSLGRARAGLARVVRGARDRQTGHRHRLAPAGFRLFWTWKSRRRLGRPTVPLDVRT